MADFLPFVMQQLLNKPLAMSIRDAEIVVAALSGRLQIASLERAFMDNNRGILRAPQALNREDLAKVAAIGRSEADLQAGKKMSTTPSATDGDNGKTFEQVGDVAIIRVWGTLTRTWGVGPYSGSTGYDGIQVQLLDAMADDTVEAIWFDINSGGGTIDGLFDLVDLIWACNYKNGGKHMFAMAADYAYSAAFLIATAADKVIVPRSGGVGSAGIITMHADLTGAYDKAGVNVVVIRSARRKAIGAFNLALDEEEIAHIEGQIAELGEMMSEMVARNMGISKISVSQTEGLDYMGDAAKAIGFVTDVLPEPAAWAKLRSRIDRSS